MTYTELALEKLASRKGKNVVKALKLKVPEVIRTSEPAVQKLESEITPAGDVKKGNVALDYLKAKLGMVKRKAGEGYQASSKFVKKHPAKFAALAGAGAGVGGAAVKKGLEKDSADEQAEAAYMIAEEIMKCAADAENITAVGEPGHLAKVQEANLAKKKGVKETIRNLFEKAKGSKAAQFAVKHKTPLAAGGATLASALIANQLMKKEAGDTTPTDILANAIIKVGAGNVMASIKGLPAKVQKAIADIYAAHPKAVLGGGAALGGAGLGVLGTKLLSGKSEQA